MAASARRDDRRPSGPAETASHLRRLVEQAPPTPTIRAPTMRGPPRMAWRRWRVPLALIGVIVLGGIAIAMIGRLCRRPHNGYLDPASSAPDGAHALTDILGERGDSVMSVYSPVQRPRRRGSGRPPATPAPPNLHAGHHQPLPAHPRAARRLGRARADLLVVEPGRARWPRWLRGPPQGTLDRALRPVARARLRPGRGKAGGNRQHRRRNLRGTGVSHRLLPVRRIPLARQVPGGGPDGDGHRQRRAADGRTAGQERQRRAGAEPARR